MHIHTSVQLIYIRTPLSRDARTNARIRAATSSAPKLLGGTSSNRSCSLRISMQIYTHIWIHINEFYVYVYVSVYNRDEHVYLIVYLKLTPMYSLTHKHAHKLVCTRTLRRHFQYGVALVSRIDKIIGLFCKRALQKSQYSAKETYNLIDPTIRSHPIAVLKAYVSVCTYIYTHIFVYT